MALMRFVLVSASTPAVLPTVAFVTIVAYKVDSGKVNVTKKWTSGLNKPVLADT